MFIVRPSEPERIGLYASNEAPRRGEEGILDVCQRLVDGLKVRGIFWDSPAIPVGPEEGVDCVCQSSEGPVKIQVTRAVHDREFFATLGEHKAVTAYTTSMELAQALFASIEHKARRTPKASRSSLVLVLDAAEFFLPGNSKPVRLFEAQFTCKTMSFGFRAIWLVGSHRQFVTQLA